MTGIGSLGSVAVGGGMADVVGRIAAIQSRIDGLTGAGRGAAAVGDPTRDAAAGVVTAGVGAAGVGAAGVRAAGAFPSLAAAPAPSASTGAGGAGRAAATDVADPRAAVAALAAKLPEHARAWAPDIAGAALQSGIDPTLFASLVRHESNFDPGARSHAGAIGLAQLMPGTAAGLGVDPHVPPQNLAGGARFLDAQLDRFGSVDLALAAYNAGPSRVAQAGGVPRIPETLAYVDRVIATWEQWR